MAGIAKKTVLKAEFHNFIAVGQIIVEAQLIIGQDLFPQSVNVPIWKIDEIDNGETAARQQLCLASQRCLCLMHSTAWPGS